MTRRQEFARLIPHILARAPRGKPVHLAEIYSAIEVEHPALADDEVEVGTGSVRWKHELRWELETLVGAGEVLRRKDLGRGLYSV